MTLKGTLRVSKSQKTLLVGVEPERKEYPVDVASLPDDLKALWEDVWRRRQLTGIEVSVDVSRSPVRILSADRPPSQNPTPSPVVTKLREDTGKKAERPLPYLEDGRDVALVILASEQLWPNLEAVCLYRRVLRRLFILHTDHPTRSVQPAHAIANIVKAQFGIPAELVRVGMEPRQVTQGVRGILENRGGLRVVLNATGGTKLMTAGMLRWVGEPGTATIYREFGGTWFELQRAEDNRQIVAIPIETPGHPTDVLNVRVLVEQVWGIGGYDVIVEGDLPELPVEEIARRACANTGKPDTWQQALATAIAGATGRGGQSQAGFLFEQFVGACIRHLGVTNGVMNVERRHGAMVLQELDIVANAGGRVCVVDCKLPQSGETAAIAQCLTASHVRRQLGGLSGGYMLVRPNWLARPWLKDLCSSLGIELIDSQDFGQFCQRLAQFLGGDANPEKVEAVDRWLREYNARRPLPGMRPPSPKHQSLAQQTVTNVVIPTDPWLSELAHTGNRNWAALLLRQWALLVVFPPAAVQHENSPPGSTEVDPNRICQFVRDRLQRAGYSVKVCGVRRSIAKTSVTLILDGVSIDALRALPDVIPVT